MGEMGRLHSFDANNHDDILHVILYAHNITVSGNKVILLLSLDGASWAHQLVVLQEGEQNWENKTLEAFSTPKWGRLAVDKDWWAVADEDESRPDVFKVKLW